MTIEPTKFSLRVPSTTANLGPGFDCLGLALELDNSWTVEVTTEGSPGECRVIECLGEGERKLPKDEGHLFFGTWKTLHQRGFGPDLRLALKLAGLAVHLSARNGTPLARGLGSSAALRVASSEAYRRLTGACRWHAWQLAAVIEGHPDNAAPAGLGGLVSGLYDARDGWRALDQPIHDCWQVVTAIPEFSLLTVEARRVLPRKYDKSAILHNLSRLPFLIEGLRRGDGDLVGWGCDDKLHQPQRAGLIPGFYDVLAAGTEAGAAAVYLSGAGPTIAAFVDRRRDVAGDVAKAMGDAFKAHGVKTRVQVMDVDRGGLTVLEGQLH